MLFRGRTFESPAPNFCPAAGPMRYLDPKNDLTFRKVFGQHPHLLRSFLNALLPLEEG